MRIVTNIDISINIGFRISSISRDNSGGNSNITIRISVRISSNINCNIMLTLILTRILILILQAFSNFTFENLGRTFAKHAANARRYADACDFFLRAARARVSAAAALRRSNDFFLLRTHPCERNAVSI